MSFKYVPYRHLNRLQIEKDVKNDVIVHHMYLHKFSVFFLHFLELVLTSSLLSNVGISNTFKVRTFKNYNFQPVINVAYFSFVGKLCINQKVFLD